MPPTLYIKNALRIAEMGLGDGTIYAGGSSAAIQQGNKRIFFVNYFQIGDLPPSFDDQFNGYFVYFPVSGNKYHIVDFVSSDKSVTTWEVPAATDTGPCEVRRALVDSQALAGNPTHRLADGQKFAPWKSGTLPIIDIHLPNHIDDGGFEGGLGKWALIQIGGTTDTSGINVASPILGNKDMKLDLGDRASVFFTQSLQRPMFKERKYRVLFKARYTGGAFNTGDFTVGFMDGGSNARAELPGFENPSSGTVTSTSFQPLLTTSNAWHWADVVMRGEDIDGGFARFGFRIFNNAITINLDEVYVFERVNVDSLIVFDHNSYHFWTIRGRYCAKDRTGVVNGIDESTLVTSQTVLKDPYIHEFTGGIFPIYELENTTVSIPQASEILLGETWVWGRHIRGRFDPNLVVKKVSRMTTRSGVRHSTKHFQNQKIKGKVVNISDIDRAKWTDDFFPHHHENEYPFAVKLDATSPIVLMRDESDSFGTPMDGPRASIGFDWIEVI